VARDPGVLRLRDPTRTHRYAEVRRVDSEHAADTRQAMANANADIGRQHADYVVRIVADEHERGRAMLERFQDEESSRPVVVTTARLLTTGVDIPTLHTVVLFRPIRSVVEFKQIIGRGSRLAPDFDKHTFEIIDFTGATVLFEDPEFDGPADVEVEDVIDDRGQVVDEAEMREPEQPAMRIGRRTTPPMRLCRRTLANSTSMTRTST